MLKKLMIASSLGFLILMSPVAGFGVEFAKDQRDVYWLSPNTPLPDTVDGRRSYTRVYDGLSAGLLLIGSDHPRKAYTDAPISATFGPFQIRDSWKLLDRDYTDDEVRRVFYTTSWVKLNGLTQGGSEIQFSFFYQNEKFKSFSNRRSDTIEAITSLRLLRCDTTEMPSEPTGGTDLRSLVQRFRTLRFDSFRTCDVSFRSPRFVDHVQDRFSSEATPASARNGGDSYFARISNFDDLEVQWERDGKNVLYQLKEKRNDSDVADAIRKLDRAKDGLLRVLKGYGYALFDNSSRGPAASSAAAKMYLASNRRTITTALDTIEENLKQVPLMQKLGTVHDIGETYNYVDSIEAAAHVHVLDLEEHVRLR